MIPLAHLASGEVFLVYRAWLASYLAYVVCSVAAVSFLWGAASERLISLFDREGNNVP
jgi:hypothetical protein